MSYTQLKLSFLEGILLELDLSECVEFEHAKMGLHFKPQELHM